MEKNIFYRTWFYEGIRPFLLCEESVGGESICDPENDLELFSRKSQLHLTGRVNDWKLKIAGVNEKVNDWVNDRVND